MFPVIAAQGHFQAWAAWADTDLTPFYVKDRALFFVLSFHLLFQLSFITLFSYIIV
jgi:hypothetical protein